MRPATPPPGSHIPAIGYIRVSTWYEEKISDEIQKAVIADTAARRGRHIVAWITDLDESGRHFKRRIMQAIEAVETGALEGAREIWVWKFSRFGRNRHGVAINTARVEQAGGELVSATEDIDPTTAVGKFTRGMLFELAAFESDRAGEQWRETHEYRRAHGLPATGRPRFGYLWTPRKAPDGTLQQEGYDPDPGTYRDLVDMYRMYAEGAGFSAVADWVHSQGHRTVRGSQWSINSVLRYLDSGFGAGLLRVHQPEVRCPRSQRFNCAVREHYAFLPGSHTPVIGDDLWEEYQRVRDDKRRTPARLRYAKYPLSGLVKCGRCGGPAVTAGAHGVRAWSYVCSRRKERLSDCPGSSVRRDRVEEYVLEWLQQLSREIDEIARGVRVVPAPRKKPDSVRERKALTVEVSRLATALDNAFEAYTVGDVPRESYVRTRDKLLARKAEKEQQLAALAEDEGGGDEPGPLAYREVVAGLLEEWDTMPVAALRDLLARVIRSVAVDVEEDGAPLVVVPTWAV